MKTQLEIITGRIISSYLSTVDGGEISRLQVPNQNRRVGGIRSEKNIGSGRMQTIWGREIE